MAPDPAAPGKARLPLKSIGIAVAVLALAAGGFWTYKHVSAARRKAALAASSPAKFPQAAPEKGWTLARYCPEKTVALVGLRNWPGITNGFSKTSLGRIVESPAVRQTMAMLPFVLRQKLGRALPDMRPFQRFAAAASGETVLVLTEIETPEHYQPIPHLLLAAKPAGGDVSVLESLAADAFAALAADEPGLKIRIKDYDAKTRIHLLGDAEVTFAYAVQDGVLLASSQESTLQNALDLNGSKGSSLGTLPAFRELEEEVGCRDAFVYLNTSPLWERLPADAHRMAKAAGMTEADAFAMGAEILPPGFHERLAFHTEGPRGGLLEVLDNAPVSRKPSGAPANLQSFGQVNFSLLRLWDAGLRTAQQGMSPSDYNAMLAGLEAANQQFGFRLREDLLQSLGDSITYTQTPGPDPLHPDWVCAWSLTNPSRLSECLQKLMSGIPQENGAVFHRRWLGDMEVFSCDAKALGALAPVPDPQSMPPFSFAVCKDTLVLASRPELVSGYASGQAPAGENKPLLDALAQAPEQSWAVSYSDFGAVLARTFPENLGAPPDLLRLQRSLARSLGGQSLPPLTASLYATPHCVVLDTRSPFPAASLAGTAAVLAVVLPMTTPSASGAAAP